MFQAQNEISPIRRPSSSTTPSEEAAEGFICPGCMSSFSTPQDLEVHYDKEHLNGNGSSNGKYSTPIPRVFFTRPSFLKPHSSPR